MDIVQIISTVGFPIAACVAMGWYIVQRDKNMNETVQKNTDAINQMIDLFKKEV